MAKDRQAMALAERAGSVDLKMRAQQRLASALCRLGDTTTSKVLALDGLAAARAQGLRHAEARFLSTLSVIAAVQCDLITTLDMAQQQLLSEQELGNRRGEAMVLGNIGSVLLYLGECKEARRHLEEGLRLSRSVGDRGAEPYPWSG